ncbi:major facilitator superfamily domain-containing protein [Mycena rosella]|uniref:Major facilitator superfamily domain-containing protein n=1 Tax=Mycena rosella TaxID=1033263 RepID=A0AAD7CVT6_MYCRO|nr:major facilitator superfamily domain-containing protein [Mycena rosella]
MIPKRDAESSSSSFTTLDDLNDAKGVLSAEKSRPPSASSSNLQPPPCPSSILTSSSTTLDAFCESCPELSTGRLLAAHIGAALALFLATTDATIVSTSLPTIASELNMTQNEYSWVGIAYMLTQTAFQPLYGRISDLMGRKDPYCAARPRMLICAGGIVGSVWVITAEIVEVRSRAKWSQALSVTWSCSAIAGPLLGGLFSVYMNLPVCSVAFVVLFISLRQVQLGKAKMHPGAHSSNPLISGDCQCLFMAGSSFIVVGFSLASQNGWKAPSTLLLICLGLVILVCGGVYETRTKRDCCSQRQPLKIPEPAANGSTPLQAGFKLLPYSLGSSLASMPAAWFMSYWQQRTQSTRGQNWVVAIGLLNLLDERSSITAELFPLVSGIGLGMLFHAPYQVFTRTLEQRDLAAGTSAFFLVRFTGATVGLVVSLIGGCFPSLIGHAAAQQAIAGAVFDARVYTRIPPDLLLNGGSSIDFIRLGNLQPVELKMQVLHILATSIQTVWTVCAPCLGLSFLLSLALLRQPVERTDNTPSDEKVPTPDPA